jgi:hypothetical protein
MVPCMSHETAVKLIPGYLEVNGKGRIMFDASYLDHPLYPAEDHPNRGEFYRDTSEEIPPNLPMSEGKSVRIAVCVDANFAHDLVTRRSVTGILFCLNITPRRWLCKPQKTVQSFTYDSELIVSRYSYYC